MHRASVVCALRAHRAAVVLNMFGWRRAVLMSVALSYIQEARARAQATSPAEGYGFFDVTTICSAVSTKNPVARLNDTRYLEAFEVCILRASFASPAREYLLR